MPFESKAQRGYLFVHNPTVAREFAAATPKGAELPEHVRKRKRRNGLAEALKKR